MRPDWFRRSLSLLVWCIPISLLLILPVVATRTTRQQQTEEYLRLWGRTPADLQKVSLRGLAGWDLPEEALLPQPTHHHPYEASQTVLPEGLEILFAHFGDGPIAGTSQSFRSTVFLANLAPYSNRGTIEFYDDAGQPVVLTLNGGTASSFSFQLVRSETRRFDTSGTGSLKSGWVRVIAEQPIGGQVVFGIRDGQNRVVTDVGVSESTLGTRFTLFADSIGSSRTGVALCNPSATMGLTLTFDLYDMQGQLVTTQERSLSPYGHLGIFLNELFSGTAGIDEFQGSVIITSRAPGAPVQTSGAEGAPPFGGVTLRSTGSLLTSLPMVETKSPESPVKRLAFPHVGDGDFGGLAMVTSVVLINTTSTPASGAVHFTRSDGTPMEVRIGEETGSSFLVQIAPLGVTRLTTSGTGAPKVGWAEVTMDQELSGAAIFQMVIPNSPAGSSPTPQSMARPRAIEGSLSAEVGVTATPIYKRSRILIDTSGVFNTGVALVNPADPVEDSPDPISVYLNLYDSGGTFTLSRSVELPPRGHLAQFVSELFPDLPADFQGSLLLTSSGFFAPLALRSAQVKLTSTPVLLGETTGFAPISTVEPAQNLAGTSPAIRWMLHQNDGDFSLEKVKISIPEMGLVPSAVVSGQELASGYFPRGSNSRVFRFFVTGTGSIDFEAFSDTSDGLERQGSGRIEGSPTQGLTIEMQLEGKPGFTKVGGNADQYYDFPPGIFRLPTGRNQIEVQAELTSVSTRPDRSLPVVRRTRQTLSLTAPDPVTANLETVSPRYLEPGNIATFTGTHFGSEPVIHFPIENDQTVEVATFTRDDGATAAFVPQGIVDGEIAVDNGSGPGNPYAIDVVFGPTFWAGVPEPLAPAESVTPRSTGSTFGFRIVQPLEQLAVTDFAVDTSGIGIDLSSLAVDALVGSGSIQRTAFALKVGEVAPDGLSATLTLVSPTDPASALGGRLRLEYLGTTPGAGIRFIYLPDSSESDPFFVDCCGGLTYEFRFDLLPITLPTSGELILSLANIVSAPMGGGGRDAARSVELFSIEQME